jgi:hypothetical protein
LGCLVLLPGVASAALSRLVANRLGAVFYWPGRLAEIDLNDAFAI